MSEILKCVVCETEHPRGTDDRIKDGVCPNGCARMTQVAAGDFECPVCHFTLSQRTL